MPEFAPVLYVDTRQSRTGWPRKRPQRWYWVLKSSGNWRRLARSSGMYTNRADAEAGARLAFASSTTVYLRRREQGNELLRLAPKP